MSMEVKSLHPDDPSRVASPATGREPMTLPGGQCIAALTQRCLVGVHLRRMHMRSGRLLFLLVVLVLCIAVTAPPALSATVRTEHRSSIGSSDVQCWSGKGEGESATGDDDRWGGPNGNGAEEDMASDDGEDEEDERPSWQNPSVRRGLFSWFLFGRWFVL